MTSKIAGLLLLWALPLYSATISGYVVDAKTGETIIGMNVLVDGSDLGSFTDTKGFFIIQRVPEQTVTLHFSHIGYVERQQQVNAAQGDIFLGNVAVQPRAIQGEAIEVSGRRGELIESKTDISGFQVEPVVLKEVPQFNNDVFRLVKYSPSVTISDALSPLYYVRGGSAGENLVQLDGMTIYNPQHALSRQAIFNPYSIKNIEMLPGGFDAQYGGRNSSILNITTREGDQRETLGEFRPSTSGIVGAIEFPVSEQGTAMISGRLISSLLDRVVMGIPKVMGDFNGASQGTFGRTKLKLSTFWARDYFDYDFSRFSLYLEEPELRDMKVGYQTSTSNLAIGIQSRTLITPNFAWENHLCYSGFNVDNTNFLKFTADDTTENADLLLDYRTRVRNSVYDFTAKSHIAIYTPYYQTLKLGFERTWYQFRNRVGEYSVTTGRAALSPELHSAFVQDQLDYKRFTLKSGVRLSAFSPEVEWRTAPRISAVLRMPGFDLKFAWGKYFQYITAMNSQDFELSQFVEYYYPILRKAPLESVHYIAGIEGSLSKNLEYTATAYYKDMPRLYRFDYSNTTSAIYAYQAQLEQGTGKAYGVEFLLKGSWQRFSGWAGYSFSRATRSYPSIQNGKTFLYDGDQAHNLKAVLLYNFTRDITGSMSFQLTSGFPKTWATGYVNHYNYDPVGNSYGVYPVYLTPVKNNVRFPPRLILDFGWKKQLRSGFGHQLAEYLGANEAYFTMTLQNLLFLWRNPWIYFYIPDYGYYGLDYNLVPMVNVGYVIKF